MSDTYLDIAAPATGGFRVARAQTGIGQIVFSGTVGPVIAQQTPEGWFPMQVRSVAVDGLDVAVCKIYGPGNDAALVVNSAGEMVGLGSMTGDQSCAIAVAGPRVLVAVVQPDARHYLLALLDALTLVRVQADQILPIPLPNGTSQGMLSMSSAGEITWTDISRTIDYGGVRLSLPLAAGAFVIGQASPLPGSQTFEKVTVCFDVRTRAGYLVSKLTGAPPRLAVDAVTGQPCAAISLLSTINAISFSDWAPWAPPGETGTGGGGEAPGGTLPDNVIQVLTALMGEIPDRLRAMERAIGTLASRVEALERKGEEVRSTITIIDRDLRNHNEALVPWLDNMATAVMTQKLAVQQAAARAEVRHYTGRVLGMSATFAPVALEPVNPPAKTNAG